MFAGLLSSVPLVWKVPVLLLFVLLLMFLLVLAFGYRVRLPLWLGELGPAGAGGLATEIRQLKQLLAESQAAADRRDPRALRRLGSSVQELDTVDWAGEEEVELRRRRCSLDTVHRTSSLPVTPSRVQARTVLKAVRRVQREEEREVEEVEEVEVAGRTEVPVDLTVTRVERIEVVETKTLAADTETEEDFAKDEQAAPETPRKSLVVAGDAVSGPGSSSPTPPLASPSPPLTSPPPPLTSPPPPLTSPPPPLTSPGLPPWSVYRKKVGIPSGYRVI